MFASLNITFYLPFLYESMTYSMYARVKLITKLSFVVTWHWKCTSKEMRITRVYTSTSIAPVESTALSGWNESSADKINAVLNFLRNIQSEPN